jgi:hypothetical protein
MILVELRLATGNYFFSLVQGIYKPEGWSLKDYWIQRMLYLICIG